ncbi:response regulator [Pontibacter sp. H259]|uniref:response regulator n=1 Tax=Pontibacter sp. H259 TaxID=3133421 RepID=UPI0030BBD406
MNKLNQVLIVDDDEVNNVFCKIVIEHMGISGDVHYCMSGPEALAYLKECISTGMPIPELILLDINMPFMDGFEFLNTYHALGYDRNLHTKISMLSSSDVEKDVKAALKYNSVIDYVTKPLSEAALNRLVYKLSSPSQS